MKAFKSHTTFVYNGEDFECPFSKILVTGLGRSGTSAIATLLHHCGYYLGDVEESSTKEDRTLREYLKSKNYSSILDEFEKMSSSYNLIGFKDPKLYSPSHKDFIASLPNDWLIICVTRDPLAIAQRRIKSEKISFSNALVETIEAQDKLIRFAISINKPCLLISYEKFIAHPILALHELSDFIYLESKNIHQIAQKVFVDKEKYLNDANKMDIKEIS